MTFSDRRYQSWGNYPRAKQHAVKLQWRQNPLPLAELNGKTVLARGNGRSYGDCCLNDGGVLLDTLKLDRFIEFDAENGVLRCEGGVLLSDVLAIIVPRGWFLRVSPGTQFVTVGGAIANDVHGKNHHRAGTFGCHVRCFELLRSDGSRLHCSPVENRVFFQATIGGLGLTGLITWAEISLTKASAEIAVETIRYRTLDEFFELSRESDQTYEHTMAWLDCTARGKSLGRGIFMRGNHVERPSGNALARRRALNLPIEPPVPLVNALTLKAFNLAYYWRNVPKHRRRTMHYSQFLYPLDGIRNWNRMYGPHGFMQYQSVVPLQEGQNAIREILKMISASHQGSFLAVLKVFGTKKSPGLLSWPRPGVTLALDFANRGARTLQLLETLDETVREAGGSVYPAKDARMSAASFRHYFPNWRDIIPFMDRQFSSSFFRRVTEGSDHA